MWAAKELDDFVNFIFEKFATSRGLIGTPLTCLNLLEQLENIGVNEVSCLLDFGLNKNVILSHLPDLNQLREVYNHQVNNKINSIKTTDSVSLNSPSKKLITKQFSHRVAENFAEIRRRFTDTRKTNQPSLYLPVGVKSVQVYEPMTNQVWSHGFLSNSLDTANKSIEGDVCIFNPNGKLLARVSGLQMQCVERLRHQIEIQNQYADWFYKLQWQLKPLVKLQSSCPRDPGSWMIFADELGIGQSH